MASDPLSNNTVNNHLWQDDFVLFMDAIESSSKRNPSVGTTPKDCLYKENKLHLYCYKPLDVVQKDTPILIVYALVNRPYITDLEPNRSLVLTLLKQGYPVYLIDWGYPDSSDSHTSLNDYINGYIQRCVKRVSRHAKVKKIDLLGICQGGVFSLCYSALHPEHIRKLVTLVTPVDFHSEGNILSLWTKSMDTELLINKAKNISGELINTLFKSMKPFQLNREKYRHLSQLINQPKQLDTFLRMEKWLNDSPDLAGTAATEFVQKFYQKNQLHKGSLTIGDKHIKLDDISCPVLNLYADNDHIVPPSSTTVLKHHIRKALYQEKKLRGGHIGVFTSPRTQKVVMKALTQYLG
ncbi:MAG: class III poly(R)-hydroxyalkanoic acid synthase subunit PhaC [Piscirickettsiaceae bacterium]|nr:MAG: class III poly(R)-hydroxyalkanoic acid synthase subunit PhaC [Piscirickettsiaceae bacterium]